MTLMSISSNKDKTQEQNSWGLLCFFKILDLFYPVKSVTLSSVCCGFWNLRSTGVITTDVRKRLLLCTRQPAHPRMGPLDSKVACYSKNKQYYKSKIKSEFCKKIKRRSISYPLCAYTQTFQIHSNLTKSILEVTFHETLS